MSNFLKINLDGTDYWIGGLDANKDKQLQWMTGNLMNKTNTYRYNIVDLSTHD